MSVRVHSFAVFSPCRRYRYVLGRLWSDEAPAVFVGLNPSTADETADDQTIRRCIRYARDWGRGGLVMLNLFALVSTDPRALLTADDPVGTDNDRTLREWTAEAGVVVAAWGAFPQARERAQSVVDSGVLGNFTVLGLTKDGHPRHPSRLRIDCRPLNPLTALTRSARRHGLNPFTVRCLVALRETDGYTATTDELYALVASEGSLVRRSLLIMYERQLADGVGVDGRPRRHGTTTRVTLTALGRAVADEVLWAVQPDLLAA